MSNDLIIPEKPKAPMAAKHRRALSGRIDIDGKLARPADNEPLIPVDECNAILDEMVEALVGCNADLAIRMARKLVGAYVHGKPSDPTTYSEVLALGVAQCPPDLLPELFDRLTSEQSFMPTRAEVVAMANRLTYKRRLACDIAKGHLKAHDQRADKASGKSIRDMTPEEATAFWVTIRELQAKAPPVEEPEAVPTAEGFKTVATPTRKGLSPEKQARMAEEMAEMRRRLADTKAEAPAQAAEAAE